MKRSCISYHYQGRFVTIATGFSISNPKTFSTTKEEGYARLHSLLCMAFAIRSDSLFLSSHPHFLFTKPCPLTKQLQYCASISDRKAKSRGRIAKKEGCVLQPSLCFNLHFNLHYHRSPHHPFISIPCSDLILLWYKTPCHDYCYCITTI